MCCSNQVYLSPTLFFKNTTSSPVLILDTGFRKVLLKIPYIKLHLVSSIKFSLLFSGKANFLTIVTCYLSFLLPENL